MPVTPNNDVYASAGCKISIGTSVSIDFTSDTTALTAFKAISTYSEVKSVQDIGDFGDEAEEIKFTSLGDARVRKVKGARDAGDFEVTVGRNPTDPGQVAMRAAAASNAAFAIKVELTDAQIGGTGNNTALYFRAMINSAQTSVGSVTNTTLEKYKLSITSKIITDVAA